LEEQLVRRLMSRVQVSLDQRLREATAKVVIEQTRALGPALRREIEQAVREAVAQALQAEDSPVDTPKPG
jgi:Arc/MetJ family transcription regulator